MRARAKFGRGDVDLVEASGFRSGETVKGALRAPPQAGFAP